MPFHSFAQPKTVPSPRCEPDSPTLQGVSEIRKRGLDIVSIKVESPSPSEAALISNRYAEAYADYSLSLTGRSYLNREFLKAGRKI
jgi:hypothetical protein